MKAKRLFPSDTRCVELVSGASMIIVSLLFVIGRYGGVNFSELHRPEFWVLLTLVFGLLQVFSIIEEQLEHLRFVLCWFAGTFWVWAGLDTLNSVVRPTEVATVILGVSNFYAFILNAMMVKKQLWN